MSGTGIIFYGICFTQLLFDPPSIGANTSVDIQFPLPGALITDVVLSVSKPSLTAGLDIGNTRMTANGIMSVTYQNSTATPINAGAEVYTISIARPEKVLGGPDALSGGNVIFS